MPSGVILPHGVFQALSGLIAIAWNGGFSPFVGGLGVAYTSCIFMFAADKILHEALLLEYI